MISVVIQTLNNAATLPACLAALVPAAVDAIVREVILVDGGSIDATLEIAEDAGAKRAATVEAAVAAAKSEWLLILPATVRLEPGWEAEAAAHVQHHIGTVAVFRPAFEDLGLVSRVRRLFDRGEADQALLVAKVRYGRPSGRLRRLNSRGFVT
jgi:glycosyltransferase involved in cell wall biosynthesis